MNRQFWLTLLGKLLFGYLSEQNKKASSQKEETANKTDATAVAKDVVKAAAITSKLIKDSEKAADVSNDKKDGDHV